MNKILTVLIFLLFGSIICAQTNNTSSPYSRFGIGELSSAYFGQNHALGGTSIGIRSRYNLNPLNPASYSAIDTMETGAPFLFETGLISKTSWFASTNQKTFDNNANLSYIAFGFPIAKWLFSAFGLKPYSNVGYKIKNTVTDPAFGTSEMSYYGSGGINSIFGGLSLRPFSFVSLGANANYLFGYLRQTNSIFFTDDATAFNAQTEKDTRFNDVSLRYGLQFHFNKTDSASQKKQSFNLGFIFDTKTPLNARKDLYAGTISGSDKISIFNNTIIDTINYFTDLKGTIEIPMGFGAGFSYNYDDKFLIGMDYTFQKWSDVTSFGLSDSLGDGSRISFGMEYTPKRNNMMKGFSNFLQRSSYRIGGYYADSYLMFPDKGGQLSQFGISFGLGLPMRSKIMKKKYEGYVNLFFEFGQLGTKDNGLLKETYGIVGINLSLYDIWFVKRKYD